MCKQPNQTKGQYIGEKVMLEGRPYKIVFYTPNGMKSLVRESDGHSLDRSPYTYIGVDLETKQWDYFSELMVASAPKYQKTVKLTMEQLCKKLGFNIEITK